MPRPRKNNRELPPCVYPRHGAYWYVKAGKWTRLGADLKAALSEYARLASAPVGGMAGLIRQAMRSINARVAEGTRKSYADTAKRLESIFAEFAPHQVMPKHVAQLRRAYLTKPAAGNHLLSLLRQVMVYALEEELIDYNPCVGIKPLPSGKRDRLISPEEFAAIRAQASPRLAAFMDLCRLTGQRPSDIINLRRADLVEAGIYFKQQKTDSRLIVRWSPELRDAVERAKQAESHGISTMTLFSQRGGRKLRLTTIRQQWNLACRKAGIQDAQMRDLRAMSGTEAKQQGLDPTALLGHADAKMTRRYLRDREIPVVDGPSFGHVQKK